MMNIAVVGCGNMSSIVVRNLAKNNNNLKFYLYTPSNIRARELGLHIDGIVIKSFEDFKSIEIDYWIIGHKPQQLSAFSSLFLATFKQQNIVSMLAATSIDKLEDGFKSHNVIRIMPNTPVSTKNGTTLFFAKKKCDGQFYSNVLSHFSNAGVIECKSEAELDDLTLFSGSGPAYVFLFASTLNEKMIDIGFDSATSKSILLDLFLGSSELMSKSDLSFSELVSQVSSKGGVTAEAISVFRDMGLFNITSLAIDKAAKRSREIGIELKPN